MISEAARIVNRAALTTDLIFSCQKAFRVLFFFGTLASAYKSHFRVSSGRPRKCRVIHGRHMKLAWKPSVFVLAGARGRTGRSSSGMYLDAGADVESNAENIKRIRAPGQRRSSGYRLEAGHPIPARLNHKKTNQSGEKCHLRQSKAVDTAYFRSEGR